MADREAGAGAWPLPVVIAAGGQGKRLRPFTGPVPKALIEVNGVPIIDRIIGRFRGLGCTSFWIATGYLGDRLKEHFDAHEGVSQVRLVDDGDLRGSATWWRTMRGALQAPFILSACDVLVDADRGSRRKHDLSKETAAAAQLLLGLDVVEADIAFAASETVFDFKFVFAYHTDLLLIELLFAVSVYSPAP